MPRYSVYRNRNSASRVRFPLLLDIQSDLLDPLATRVVVPLSPMVASRSRVMQTLTPVLHFESKDYVMVTPQLSGVAAQDLGPSIGDFSADREKIIAALDLLITGI
jgi:toxin CcdB